MGGYLDAGFSLTLPSGDIVEISHDEEDARAILDPAGPCCPDTAGGPLEAFRFRAERDTDRAEQIVVRAEAGGLTVAIRPNRPFDETAKSFFERDWPDWLTGRIFDLGPGGR